MAARNEGQIPREFRSHPQRRFARELRLDIESVAEKLPAGERMIFELVAKSVSRENIVDRLKITRHAVDAGIKTIRRKMERAGLNCE